MVSTASAAVNVLASGVAVTSPAPNATVSSPVHLIAAAASASKITSMQVVVDGVSSPSAATSSINTFLDTAPGPHHIGVNASDSAGQAYQSAVDIDVQPAPPPSAGPQQFLDLPFQAGVTHIGGRYGFTQKNFLIEGAERISAVGSSSIFVALYPKFRINYPDKSANLWPATTPTSLKALAQTKPYTSLFNMPFKLIVLTAHSFSNNLNLGNFLTDPNAAVAEEQEFYDLALYLYATYAGSGKTFILKHWEGDQLGLQGASNTTNLTPSMVQAMTDWLSARQRGVSRARLDAGNPTGVTVLNAVEVNRVMDVSRSGLTRVINAIVPVVKPDMVTYSSYDSTLRGTNPASMAAALTEAFSIIKGLAPDPLGLGDSRILVSEYGLEETKRPLETEWRAQTLIEASKAAGLSAAFLWQVYDNECKDASGNYFPVDTGPGATLRPVASQCHGLWLYRPDGSESKVIGVLSPDWN